MIDSLGSRIFFPLKFLQQPLHSGWLVGWNINDFTICVMAIVSTEEYPYASLKNVLEHFSNNAELSDLKDYCGGVPTIIGYMSDPCSPTDPPRVKDSLPIFLQMSMSTPSTLLIEGKLFPSPKLLSIYCMGVRHSTSAQIVLFEDIDSAQLHYYSRMPSGYLAPVNTTTSTSETSELDYALHQINSMKVFKLLLYQSLRGDGQRDDDKIGATAGKESSHWWIGHILIGASIFFRSFAEMVITLLSARIMFGKSLRELSALAHVMDSRLRVLCHLPFALEKANRASIYKPTPLRNMLHFKAYSDMTLVVIDVLVGVFVGIVLFLFSSRSDFVLRTLHYMFNVLHMEVLNDSTLWLMDVPAGLKLNTKLTEWLGTNVLAILDLFNLVTTKLAALEPTIVVLIGFCGAMGSSFVLAVLVDLVHCVTAHILLIYSAFASLHSATLYVISSLWHLFRGRKRNVLRNRVDTLVCTIEQLLLGTLMFTMTVFLFPTLVVYYFFFLTVWMTILIFQAIIWVFLAIMTTVPFYAVLVHSLGSPHNQCLPGAIRLSICQPAGQNVQVSEPPPPLIECTHLRLKGVPAPFSELFRTLLSYLSTWYRHYRLVGIVEGALSGRFVGPLPFIQNDLIANAELPTANQTRELLKRWWL
jgi:hypothetical protein